VDATDVGRRVGFGRRGDRERKKKKKKKNRVRTRPIVRSVNRVLYFYFFNYNFR
jgi:hypothetical protein